MFTNNLIAGASGNQGGFYEFPIEQSLRFNDDDSSYLSWTPASAGNRKTWTWSGWVKRGNLTGVAQTLFGADNSAGNFSSVQIGLDASNRFYLDDNINVSSTYVYSSSVYRDTSAWYHLMCVYDTTEATSSDRMRLYVNGERITALASGVYPALNTDGSLNSTTAHQLGRNVTPTTGPRQYFDGYLAEVNFIDGQALDPTSFGEFKSGVWIPKDPSGLTYGTNGFRLSFQNDTVSEGFNTVTYTGNGGTQSINGLGLSPDLVWIKDRSNGTYYHILQDSIRGTGGYLSSNATDAETSNSTLIQSFDSDGFSLGTGLGVNQSGDSFVAWCWDAGSGSPVSNTDGSITSTVKANTAYGMSIISWTGSGTSDTVGHGLSSAPKMIIVKNRNDVADWIVFTSATGTNGFLKLNTTDAFASTATGTATSTTFSVSASNDNNGSGDSMIAYAFHSVTGYSKVGSYSGSGSTGNTITTGFKPAFVMVKRTDGGSDHWIMLDNTRDAVSPVDNTLYANLSNAEDVGDANHRCVFTDTGFTLNNTHTSMNASGASYIYIAFADTRDNAFWRDQSGNGNDWQPNNLTYQDSLPDSMTNNFATLNPLDNYNTGATLSEGNLKWSIGAADGATRSNFVMTSGKWYAEFLPSDYCGVVGIEDAITDNVTGGPSVWYMNNGQKRISGTVTNYGASYTVASDIIGLALDLDAGEVTFYKNNVSQGAITLPSSNGWAIACGSGSGSKTSILNFGQDSSFAGNKTAQGNTDDNGIGDFYYAPPSALALCTANLPDPVIDPAQDDVPSDYFGTSLWTGNGSTQSITGLGFQPDLIWAKARSLAEDHALVDIVRSYNELFPNLTNAENTTVTGFDSVTSDGFDLNYTAGGNRDKWNANTYTYVGWSWLASNGTSSNTDGATSSTVSANTKAGFSIVSWAGTGSSTTIGHGLNSTPELIINKNRDAAENWVVYSIAQSDGSQYLRLNTNSALVSDSSVFGAAPTSSVFTVGTNPEGNGTGNDHIAYCVHSVDGFSKVGTYVGNGSTDGPMLYLGFEPAFFLAKRIDGVENWFMIDNARHPYNDGNIPRLLPNTSDAEAEDASIAGDFLSNGFKIRATQNMINTSGANYIYMAFAANPFKYSLAR